MAALIALRIAAVAGLCASIALDTSPLAQANDVSINGEFIATSIGSWAQTNQRYQDEVPVISHWTITSTCRDPYDCTGTVRSDAGWTAEIVNRSAEWLVNRVLPDWQKCPDGSSAEGRQQYRFNPVDSVANNDYSSSTFAGVDRTVGMSGACGRNFPLVIEMPFRLERAQ